MAAKCNQLGDRFHLGYSITGLRRAFLTCVKVASGAAWHRTTRAFRELIMDYRTILVHCDASPKLSQRLDVAVDLAQRHNAHLIGTFVQVPFDMPAFFDGTMPTEDPFNSYEAAVRA